MGRYEKSKNIKKSFEKMFEKVKVFEKSFTLIAMKELSKPKASYFYKVVHPWILRIDPYISNQASALKVLKCCGICYPAPFLHTNWIQYS